MATERILEKTLITPRVTVVTVDMEDEKLIVGVHPTLATFVVGVEGIDHSEPHARYIHKQAAMHGHNQVVAEITRHLVEQRAIADGIAPPLVDGAL